VFRDGVPMRENSVKMLWGRGVRAGLYPLSPTEAYWFTTNNCNQVHRHRLNIWACTISTTLYRIPYIGHLS
jgi:hypothetical protein